MPTNYVELSELETQTGQINLGVLKVKHLVPPGQDYFPAHLVNDYIAAIGVQAVRDADAIAKKLATRLIENSKVARRPGAAESALQREEYKLFQWLQSDQFYAFASHLSIHPRDLQEGFRRIIIGEVDAGNILREVGAIIKKERRAELKRSVSRQRPSKWS